MSNDWWYDVVIFPLEEMVHDTEDVDLNKTQKEIIDKIYSLYLSITETVKTNPQDFN